MSVGDEKTVYLCSLIKIGGEAVIVTLYETNIDLIFILIVVVWQTYTHVSLLMVIASLEVKRR